MANRASGQATSALRYASFMSYSHAADGKLAPTLQRAIQRLGKPWYRRSIVRVFRDETSLSANPGLWSSIVAALELCEYFLLMCSPEAAASPWVQKEVEWWLANRPPRRMLLVITDGTVAWDNAASDFDWSQTNCVPRVLSHRFAEEPYYIDLRWARNQEDLSLRNVRFRTATLTIAATLQGKPMEEIESEDLRQQRRLRTVALSTAAVVLVLAIVAYLAQRSSRLSGREAASQTRIADSRRMAAKASSILAEHGDLRQAILVGALAWRLAPTDEADNVLTQLAGASTDVARILGQHATDADAKAFTVAADGSPLLLTEERNGTLMFWRVPGGELAGAPLRTGHTDDQHLYFSPDGSKMLSTEGTAAKAGSVVLWDLRSRTSRVMPANFPDKTFTSDLWPGRATLSPSGRYVAIFDNSAILRGRSYVWVHNVAIWDTANGSVAIHSVAAPTTLFALHFLDEDSLLFLAEPPEQTYRSAGGYQGPLAGVWHPSTGQVTLGPRTVEATQISSQNSVAFSGDGERIILFDYHMDPMAFYLRGDGNVLHAVDIPGYAEMKHDERTDVSLSSSGERLAAGWDHQTYVWDLQRHTLLRTLDGVRSGVISGNGRWLAARKSAIGSHIMLWDLNADGKQGATVNATCESADNRYSCLRLLCEKATPMLNGDEAELRSIVGELEADRLTKLALSRPCKDEQTELWMPPAALIFSNLSKRPSPSPSSR